MAAHCTLHSLYTNRRRLKQSGCSKSCSTAPPRPRRLGPRKARMTRPQSLAGSAQTRCRPRARVLQQLASGGRPQSCRAHNLTHPSRPRKWCCAVALALSRAQVEEQCNDPKLMQCGLEKVVASDGSVEWVASHSKVSLQLHLTRRSRASALTSALPPPLRNVSSSREPSASSGTNTAWKSLRTSKAVALSRAVGERAVIPVGERTVIPRTICVARTNNPCCGRLWTLLHAGS